MKRRLVDANEETKDISIPQERHNSIPRQDAPLKTSRRGLLRALIVENLEKPLRFISGEVFFWTEGSLKGEIVLE